jgi:hypothetical protein
MRQGIRQFNSLRLVMLLGCNVQQVAAQAAPTVTASSAPAAAADGGVGRAKQLGARAGVVSPRLADCREHCTKQLDELTPTLSELERTDFTQSCRTACEQQIASTAPPAQEAARAAAAQGRSLYLMASLFEQALYCVHEIGDKSVEAQVMVAAVDASKRTPEALAADQAESVAIKLAKQMAQTKEGRRMAASQQEIVRIVDSDGPQSAALVKARNAYTAAEADALATPLGRRCENANAAAQAARAKANQTPQMVAAQQAYGKHVEAQQKRMVAALPEQRSQLQDAAMRCIRDWSKRREQRLLELK